MGFNNPWIHLVFKDFNWVSMSKIPSLPFQMKSLARCLGGPISLLFQRKFYILFSGFFFIYLGIVYIWPMYYSFDESICFTIIFSLTKKVALPSKYHFFVNFLFTLSQLLSRTELTKRTPSILIENWDHLSWFINSIFICPSP